MSEQPKDESKDQSKQEKFEWTPERMSALFQGLSMLADKYLAFRDSNSKYESDQIRTITKHDRRIVAILLAFLGSVIAFMSILTWFNKVSGEALLFAVGITIGYVFAIISKSLLSLRNSADENPES